MSVVNPILCAHKVARLAILACSHYWPAGMVPTGYTVYAECYELIKPSLEESPVLMLQDIVMREAMVMRQQRHPNVLPLLAAFLSEAVLWMVMPYVAGGSAIHILNKRCPGVSSCSSCSRAVVWTLAHSVLQPWAHSFFVHRSFRPFGSCYLACS